MSELVLERSARPEVRNPVLALPSMQRVMELPLDSRDVVSALVQDVSDEARARSELNLKRNKWWTAVYWRCISIYAKHIARAMKRGVPHGG